ncbi:MAG: hypothetical protein SGJ10_08295 [Bacteroidota bacterium]|nr:hypothetical protein [Bacteroidota bacterium]
MSRKKIYIYSIVLLSLSIGLYACKKEIKKIFEVETQPVSQTSINKNLFKKELEFISIAYSDLFGKTIPANELNNSVSCYAGSNDKYFITDRIIRSYLNRGNIIIPTKQQMQGDIPKFISNTYTKFYQRPPTEMEKWKLEQLITKNTTLTPSVIYYSFLTSNEYKFK